ncbi:uncharacterized protein ARMOST_12183 [Armillaria ostoyae]|uniref:Uncharacterized protein n=1 Tax=Armillaria ostoyae TaxID=47428 RepID=A0A284RJ93_ARMOS|nr:uncharacterized protein ARMOST_12183 [Armillaria ostoyae]
MLPEPPISVGLLDNDDDTPGCEREVRGVEVACSECFALDEGWGLQILSNLLFLIRVIPLQEARVVEGKWNTCTEVNSRSRSASCPNTPGTRRHAGPEYCATDTARSYYTPSLLLVSHTRTTEIDHIVEGSKDCACIAEAEDGWLTDGLDIKRFSLRTELGCR